MGINTKGNWLRASAQFLICKVGGLLLRYLGFPIGASPKWLATWNPVVQKVCNRLSEWESKTLSFGGRIVLLKYVISALLVYFLSFFLRL